MVEIINTLTLIFIAASLTLLLARRINQPAIPAYIIAGLITGYFLTEQDQLFTLVQLGIAFLVFVFGLKFDPEKLQTVASDSQLVTLSQVILVGGLGYGAGILLGLDAFNSAIIGLASALSSTLIGMQLVESELDFKLIHGRLAESIHLLQDFTAIIAIIILSNPDFSSNAVITNLGYGLSLLMGAFIIRKYLMKLIGRQAEGSRELLMLISISILTGFMALSEQLGLSIVVGSFAAGIAVSKYPYNLEILDTVSSLKDFFAAIFFITIGALLTIPNANVLLIALFLVFVTSLVKPFLTSATLTLLGYDSRTSFATAYSVDQISELVLILAIQAHLTGIINPDVFQGIVLASIITMTVSGYTKMHEQKIYKQMKKLNLPLTNIHSKKTRIKKDLTEHTILVGYDIQGRRLAETLENMNQNFIIIENDPEKIDEIRNKDHNYIYGNVLEDKIWEEANYKKAKLILSTPPFTNVSTKIINLETSADKILTAQEPKEAKMLLNSKETLYVNLPEITTTDQIIEHMIGAINEEEYRVKLREKNLEEIRNYLNTREG